jgi:hypothetical protein
VFPTESRKTKDLPLVCRAGIPRLGGFPRHLKATLVLFFQLLILAPSFAASDPATLHAKTSEAFATYVKATDARNQSELASGKNFLWLDGLAGDAQKAAYAELQDGGDRIEQRHTLADGKEIPCPGGMIHHWEGIIFVRDAKMMDVLRVLQDYDHHAELYSPDVVRSKIESRDGDRFKVQLRFRRRKIITVVLNTEHDVQYFRDSASRAHSRSSATHIGEVEDAGKSDEREKSAGDDGGFLWGMETWWRLEEKDGGVYVQSEVVSLTRDIPAGLGWMVGPFVTSIPKETLTFTLEATRKAVNSRLKTASTR